MREDQAKPPFHNDSTDFSSIPAVRQVLSGVQIDGNDKFAGLMSFGDDPQPYFYTDAPVTQASTIVGGVLIATKADQLLLSLQQSSQAQFSTFYDLDGTAITSTIMPKADLPNLNLPSDIARSLTSTTMQYVIDVGAVGGGESQFIYAPLFIGNQRVGLISVALSRDFATYTWTINRLTVMVLIMVVMIMIIGVGGFASWWLTRPLKMLSISIAAPVSNRRARA